MRAFFMGGANDSDSAAVGATTGTGAVDASFVVAVEVVDTDVDGTASDAAVLLWLRSAVLLEQSMRRFGEWLPQQLL